MASEVALMGLLMPNTGSGLPIGELFAALGLSNPGMLAMRVSKLRIKLRRLAPTPSTGS